MGNRESPLAPGEWAVLGAVAEGPTHGFAVAQLLADGGPLGQVWTVSRPTVYQSLKKLVQQELVGERAVEPSEQGPERTILAITPAGRDALRDWLTVPVEHVRDVRSLLLLKLALIDRSGADPRPLLEAQRRRLRPQLRALERQCDETDGFDRILALWRLSSTRATAQFVDALLRSPASTRTPSTPR